MAVTMKDVAKHAGVGLGTVSNYISGNHTVSKKRGEMVQASIEALGYSVNEAARSLKSSSYKTIGVLIPSFSNTYLVRVISHIENILRSMNYSMLVVSAEGSSQSEKQLLTYLSQRVDGIIYMPTQIGGIDLKFFCGIQKLVPIVTFNENLEEFECDKVLINNGEMTYKAIKRFIEKGHKKIGMLAGLKGLYTTDRRVEGYKKALEEAGVEFNPDYIRYSSYTREEGRAQTQYLIESGVTAFFVSAYQLTLGAVWGVAEQNAQDLVSIVGFDAEEIENIVSPKLCYVYKGHKEIAQNVINVIMQRVSKDFGDFPKTIYLNATLQNIESI